jgi:hypothetical protein
MKEIDKYQMSCMKTCVTDGRSKVKKNKTNNLDIYIYKTRVFR